MRYVVLDTETTGIDHTKDGIVELAASDGKISFETMCDPGIKIPPEAMAVHHITNDMIYGMRSTEDVIRDYLGWVGPEPIYFVAHNAEFDRGMLAKFDPRLADSANWICTYRCALHLFPTAPGHSNQVLRYWLNVDEMMTVPAGLYPHRALYDVIVTEAILRVMLMNHTLDELAQMSTQPVVLNKVRFGKYKGYLWKDVPGDYMKWVVRQGDEMDKDVRHTAMHYLRETSGRLI